MEGLLPSEIARLVLGYLQEESCEEVAKSFLERSPQLSECLSLSRAGRKFSTKVQGYSLTDILEEYCSLHSIVQEQLNKLPPGNEHLKHASLVDQLKHLFGARCPVQNGQSTNNGDGESELATSTPRVRNARKSISRFQNALDQTDSYPDPPPEAQPAPDATPLESLPGNSDRSAIENTQGVDPNFHLPSGNPLSNVNFNQAETFGDNTSSVNPSKDYNPVADKQSSAFAVSAPPHSVASDSINKASRSVNLPSTSAGHGVQSHSQMYPMPEQDVQYSSSYLPAPFEQSEPPEISSDHSRQKTSGKSKTVISPGRRQSEEPPADVDVLVLKRALLNNCELQTRLADNINSVILSKDPAASAPIQQPPQTTSPYSGSFTDVLTTALDQIIPTIVEKTEADPVFETFLEEFFLSEPRKSNATATPSTQENGKSEKKKKKTPGGDGADTSGQNVSTDSLCVRVGSTPAKLEIEAAVAAASLNPMTPMTSKLIHSLTNPNATPVSDAKRTSGCTTTSSADPSPSDDSSEVSGKSERKKRTAPKSRTKSLGSANSGKKTGTPQSSKPVSDYNVQRTSQIMNSFIPIAPRPFTATLQLTLNEGRIASSTASTVNKPWRNPYLGENLIVTVNPDKIAAPKERILAPLKSILPGTVNCEAMSAPAKILHVNHELFREGHSPRPNPIAPSEQTEPANSTLAPPAPATTESKNGQEPTARNDKPTEPAPSGANDDVPQPDTSVVGTTPAIQPQRNHRRLSMSTPRRRNSHIRALDFNTPTKDEHSSQPTRKANTSPKVHKALSPNSSKAMAKLSAKRKDELSKEERNSRAKAHLFTSPEYAMTSSSGYKPSDNMSGEEISGIVAIQESTQVNSKKAWDADLRANVAAFAPQPPLKPKPAAKRKRRNSSTAESLEKKETVPEPDQKKTKNDSISLGADESTQSEKDMARLLETNIMDLSAKSLDKNEAEKPSTASEFIADQELMHEQSSTMSHNTTDDSREVNCSGSEFRTETSEAQVESVQDGQVAPTDKESEQSPKKAASPRKLFTIAEEVNQSAETSLLIPVRSDANISLMETPVKDHQPGVPPTPSIPSPNTIAQDTPITKILRAHMAELTFRAPTPTTPPTPSIKSVNELSPISAAAAAAAAYFKPSSPTRDTVRKAIMADDSVDNVQPSGIDSLEGELIRECTRIENKPQTLAKPKLSESFSTEGEKSILSDDGQLNIDSSVQEELSLRISVDESGRESDVDDINRSLQMSSKGGTVTEKTELTKSSKTVPQKNPSDKPAEEVVKPSPLKSNQSESTDLCTDTMRAKLFAMQGNDIEEALNRLHGFVDTSGLPDVEPIPETPLKSVIPHSVNTPKSVNRVKEKTSATKSKTPGKSKQKTPLKVCVKTPMKSPRDKVGHTRKTPLKSKTPIKSKTPLKFKTPLKLKTPHKSAVEVLDELIDSAKKRAMRVDPNESSSSSEASSSSASSSSSESSSDSDSESSDTEAESPVKDAGAADVSLVRQHKEADSQPLKASTPCYSTKKQIKNSPNVRNDVLLSPIHSNEALENATAVGKEPKSSSKENKFGQSQQIEQREPGKIQGEIPIARLSPSNEPLCTSAPSKHPNVQTSVADREDLPSAPARKATRPATPRGGPGLRKPAAEKPTVQMKMTPQVSPEYKKTVSNSANVKMDAEQDFVQKKTPPQLIGTLQSKERVADKVMNKQSAEDLEEKRKRMISSLKNPPDKAPRRRPLKGQQAGAPDVRGVEVSLNRSAMNDTAQVQKSQYTEESETKVKATDSLGKSENVVPVAEECFRLAFSSDEEEGQIPDCELWGEVATSSAKDAIVEKIVQPVTAMPSKQRIKNKVAQDKPARQLTESSAPPKKIIQKNAPETVGKRTDRAESDLQRPLREKVVEKQQEEVEVADLDSSLNKKEEKVVYHGDVIPPPRKKNDVDLDNMVVCFNLTLDDGEEVAQSMSVSPFFSLFEMELPVDHRYGENRVERERLRDRERKEMEARDLRDERYRKRPRSPPGYHRRRRLSSRERQSSSSSDPKRHQSSSERSQKRTEGLRSPENPRKKMRSDREVIEDGEVTSDEEERPRYPREYQRNPREYTRKRHGERDEWRRQGHDEWQRQGHRRRSKDRSKEWSSDEGSARGRVDNPRREEGRKYSQADSTLRRITSPSISRANISKKVGRSGDNEKSVPTRKKEIASGECTVDPESTKSLSLKQNQSQHVALPPDVESGNSQQSNISTVAVASNSSPENKFAVSRSGISSGKVRTRGGRSSKGHIRTLGPTLRGRSVGGKDSQSADVSVYDAQRLLRTGLNVEELLDRIHQEP